MPKAVWLQSGIRNDAAAETLARAGIKIIQDRRIMVDITIFKDSSRGRQEAPEKLHSNLLATNQLKMAFNTRCVGR